MNILDSIIGYFSPKALYDRTAYREATESLLELKHGYDGASHARLNGNSNWGALLEAQEFTDRTSRDTLRARARDLERNSDIMSSLISCFVRNVIGAGYNFQAKTGNDKLNTQIEALWKEWCKRENCDVTGQQSFTQLLRMAVRRKKIDGGILFLKVYDDKDGVLPFKLQALDVDELSNSWITPKTKGNKVAGGIEYTQNGKIAGYYITQYQIDGITPAEPVYYDAKDIIFLYSKKRPSQIREISDLAPTLTRIRDINEFINAVSMKERVSACLSIFVKKAPPLGGFGRGAVQTGSNVDYSQKRLTPGMITELNSGDDISVVDPKSTSNDATTFLKLQQRLIGAGQGLSFETFARDMSEATYSSARQGMIEDELTYLEDQELIYQFMDEVYAEFMKCAVLTGKIKIPDFNSNREQYLNHIFIKPPRKWIDPAKEADSTATALQNNIKTFAQVCAENGRDWRDVIDELADINNYAQGKGVSLSAGAGNSQNTSTSDNTDTENNDNDSTGSDNEEVNNETE